MSEATDLAISVLKDAATKKAIAMAMGKLVALVPFFGIPIVNPIVLWFVSKYAHVLFEQGALLAAMGVIEVEVNAEVKAVKKAINELDYTIRTGTPEEIQEAKDEYKKRLAALIRIGGG